MNSSKKYKRKPTLLQFLTLVLIVSFCPLAFAEPEKGATTDENIAILDRSAQAFTSVVKAAKPAVVHIEVEKTVKGSNQYGVPDEYFNNPFFERFFGPQFRHPQQPRRFKQQGQGSGFIISKEGHILTNNHVVEDADSISVTLNDKQKVPAKLIGSDPQTDVALIKIDYEGDLPTLALGNSEALEVGEWVIAIGNPFGLSQTVTVGVVSAKGRSSVGINEYENFIQTDAAINPGNSGGPLLNIHSEVVGINSALFSRTGGYMGIGFAIPINMVKAIEDQLHDHGKVTRGWLGVAIQDVNEDLAKSFGLTEAGGILVSEVQPDSPAKQAGMQRGDVIRKLDDIRLSDVNDLRNRIALLAPDSQADLEIIRDGKKIVLTVTIGEQPSDFSRSAHPAKSKGSLDQFGVSLQDLSPELAERFGYQGKQGVLITEVEPGNIGAKAGLKAGQLIEEVNKQQVTNIRELKTALANSTSPNRVLLRVRTGNYSHYVVLTSK